MEQSEIETLTRAKEIYLSPTLQVENHKTRKFYQKCTFWSEANLEIQRSFEPIGNFDEEQIEVSGYHTKYDREYDKENLV